MINLPFNTARFTDLRRDLLRKIPEHIDVPTLRHHLPDHIDTHAMREKLSDLEHRAAEAAATTAATAAARAATAASTLMAGAGPALHALHDKSQEMRHLLDHLPASLPTLRAPAPVIIQKRGPSPWWFVLGGALGGILVGLMLAPATGRRTRGLLRDKLNHAGHRAANLARGARSRAVDLKNRAEGKAASVRGAIEGQDPGDDLTIADRVRTALGENQATRDLGHFNVDCCDGIVTLRGPMVEVGLIDTIVPIVRAIRGVRDVRCNLLVNNPEDAVAFVG